MGEVTKIEWCDHTWNPWIGCQKVGAPCDNCYAEDLMDTRYGRVQWGPDGERMRTSEQTWNQLRKWNRAAEAAGVMRFVFSLSLGDIWDNKVDPAWRRHAFDEAKACQNLVMLYLSKRIGNAVDMAREADHRYPFTTTVLAGRSKHYRYAEWEKTAPGLHTKTYRRYEWRTPLNGGNGFTYECDAELFVTAKEDYLCGDTYFCGADEIHTISISQRETVLLLAQLADVVPLDVATRTYVPENLAAPRLDGLYDRMTEDRAVELMKRLEAMGNGA